MLSSRRSQGIILPCTGQTNPNRCLWCKRTGRLKKTGGVREGATLATRIGSYLFNSAYIALRCSRTTCVVMELEVYMPLISTAAALPRALARFSFPPVSGVVQNKRSRDWLCLYTRKPHMPAATRLPRTGLFRMAEPAHRPFPPTWPPRPRGTGCFGRARDQRMGAVPAAGAHERACAGPCCCSRRGKG